MAKSSADKLAATFEARIKRVILDAVRKLQADTKSLRTVTRALEAGDYGAALKAMQAVKIASVFAPVRKVIEEAFEASAKQTAAKVRLPKTSFTIVNPAAAEKAAYGARRIQAIARTTRTTINQVIAESFTSGQAPAEIARIIRPLVGLTPRDAKAVKNAYASWVKGGLTPDRAAAKAQTYSAKLIRQRSETIARTESMDAVNQGKLAQWKSMAREGLIQATRTKRVWRTAQDERVCPVCAPMHNEAVDFDQPFSNGLFMPPLHPRCRCSTVLRFTK